MPLLQFKGKTAIETYHHTVPHHALEFDEKLSVLEKGEKPSLDGNLIIEGDNLLALKALLPTHAGKIKCIYIDPPYNTGNEGWVYNDNLSQPQFKEWIGQVVGKEEEDACRHDKWCCMMYPRLQLLKELLSDEGIILVSIDDIENSNLRMMLDEIFGGGKPGDPNSSFVVQFVWKSRKSEDARTKTGVSIDHEYILCYRKTPEAVLLGSEKDRSKFTNTDNDRRGDWRSADMTGLATKSNRPNLHYDISIGTITQKTKDIWQISNRKFKATMKTVVKPESEPKGGEPGFACLQFDEEQKEWVALSLGSLKKATPKPSYSDAIFSCPEMGWRFEAKSMAGKILEGRVLWPETKEGRPRRKLFWEEMSKKYKGFTSVLTFVDTGTGTRELREIMGETTLQFPKPHALIKELIRQCTDEEDIVLDSFAGSGTTGHAVLSLNSEDEESNRRFILVQQMFDSNEDRSNQVNICQAITATRLRKVINGYKFEGDKSQLVLEEKLSLAALKKADKILEEIEEAKRLALPKYDDVKVKCENGSVTVTGIKSITSKVDGIGGSFAYARLSEKPILGEYRDITKNPPSYEEIAKYVYYTETSAVWDKKGLSNKTGKIGEHHSTSLYLLYTPNQKDDQALDVTFLNTIVAKDKNPTIVIYCEKIWIHRSELLEWSAKHKKTIRPMIVPFNLK